MTRVASGALLIVIVVGAVWWLQPIYLLAIAEAVVLLAVREYAALCEKLGTPIPVAGAMVLAMVACAGVGAVYGVANPAAVILVVMVAAVLVGWSPPGVRSVRRVAAVAFAPLYLGVPLGALVSLHAHRGREVVLLLLVTVIVSDTAQYYTGRMFGHRPLAPLISPKKTVEGAIGGVIMGSAAMAVVGRWWLPEVPAFWRLGLGLATVSVGIGGDLFESLLKRRAGMKDSSGLIPGHGGLLDRVDALLFAAPAYYVFVRFGT